MPNLVSQLNILPDKYGILRIYSKFKNSGLNLAPILLSRSSKLTELIILEMHLKSNHAGLYTLLSQLRKEFWIPKYFSTVKKIIKNCIICRRYNNRPIQVSQNDYREFRFEPSKIPFGYVFLDYCGPFMVKINNAISKVWILCITCCFTRAVNLKICKNLAVEEFLRSFQLHVFEYGLPKFCVSDLGSQLVAAGHIISDFLKDPLTTLYLQENDIDFVKFNHYFKGCSQLGSLVESCVKQVKHLIKKQ